MDAGEHAPLDVGFLPLAARKKGGRKCARRRPFAGPRRSMEQVRVRELVVAFESGRERHPRVRLVLGAR